MRVLVEGSGGAHGWPRPGCRCASCLRKESDGAPRARSAIVVDEALRIAAGGGPGAADGGGPDAADGAEGSYWTGGERARMDFRVQPVPDVRGPGRAGGWDVTSAAGERLLYPAGPGSSPDPPDGAERYDIAFLDLLGDPAQLGRLRARGLITAGTITAVAFADHRVPGEQELARRAACWRASVPADGENVTPVRSDQKEAAGGGGRPWRVLVLGGARSGKSERAELRLAGEADVTYVATGPDGAGDAEWAARVAAHKARRPAWWRTVETTDLAGVLASARGAVLIDGIGTWLAAELDDCGAWDGPAGRDRLAARTAALIAAWRQTRARVIAVSDETGLGVVPGTAAGRLFRDELGRLNQALAAESEEAEVVIAGRAIPLNQW
jgi:adenosylcobinamide kinase/adenosylcobinamide-phosphate guanylyltransferase